MLKFFVRIKSPMLVLSVLILCAINASSDDRLVFAVDVIRHGDRTPGADIPAAPHAWAEGMAELTAEGVRQEYQLGSKMRSEYVTHFKLLPSTYTAGTLYVRSTDLDRTLMSAEAFLMGLYPHGTGPSLASGHPALPHAAQPISIHSIPIAGDAMLIPDLEGGKFKDLLVRYVFSAPEWQKKNEALKPRFILWSQATGITINDLDQLPSLADTLLIYDLHHVPTPPGLSADDVQTIIAEGQWAYVARFKPPEIGRTTGRALLKTIADYIQQASQAKTPLKYVLFSAHDSTLLSQMNALGAPLTERPPYASHLHFALFDTGSQVYRVEVTYNDQPVAIPACGRALCTLPQFMALANQE